MPTYGGPAHNPPTAPGLAAFGCGSYAAPWLGRRTPAAVELLRVPEALRGGGRPLRCPSLGWPSARMPHSSTTSYFTHHLTQLSCHVRQRPNRERARQRELERLSTFRFCYRLYTELLSPWINFQGAFRRQPFKALLSPQSNFFLQQPDALTEQIRLLKELHRRLSLWAPLRSVFPQPPQPRSRKTLAELRLHLPKVSRVPTSLRTYRLFQLLASRPCQGGWQFKRWVRKLFRGCMPRAQVCRSAGSAASKRLVRTAGLGQPRRAYAKFRSLKRR